MVASVSIQPYTQTVGNAGLFSVQANGFRQGTAMADPSTRYRLRAGLLASTETLPMWGGVGVYADVPGGTSGTVGSPGNPNVALGPILGRALSLTDVNKPLAGFSVSDQAYGMITSPQSEVPLAGSGMQVNYYPLGSLARIAVACDPSLVDLRGGPLAPLVSWDFTNQLLVPYLGAQTITSGTYVSATGVITLVMAAAQTFDAGDSVTLASLTGTGAFASLDGTWTALMVSGTAVTLQGPVAAGAATITGGSLTVSGSANAALPVKVLAIESGNSETVSYVAATGFANYVFTGACALIQI
jgi:hypothetical protein